MQMQSIREINESQTITSIKIDKYNMIVAGSEDKSAKLYSALTGKLVMKFEGHLDTVSGVQLMSEHI